VTPVLLSVAFPAAPALAFAAYAWLRRGAEAAWPAVRQRVQVRGGAYRGGAIELAEAGQPTGYARAAAFVALLAAAASLPCVWLLFTLVDPERAGGIAILIALPAFAVAVAHARAGAAIVRDGPRAAAVALRTGLGTLLVAFWVSVVASAIGSMTLRPTEPSLMAALSFSVFLFGVAVLLVAASVHLRALKDNVRAAAPEARSLKPEA
jgi:hypothetical protein